jgi:hypothetical protein
MIRCSRANKLERAGNRLQLQQISLRLPRKELASLNVNRVTSFLQKTLSINSPLVDTHVPAVSTIHFAVRN